MIKVEQNNDTITFTGHSLADICASVSTCMYITVNLLMKYGNEDEVLTYDDNVDADMVTIKILKHDKIIDLIIENMFEALNDIHTDYGDDYIQIKRRYTQ